MGYPRTNEGRQKAKEYQAGWYRRNKHRYLEINRKSRKKYFDIMLTFIRDLRTNTPCADCKKAYPFWIMDFDHVRGEKFLEVSVMVRNQYSEKKILEEIAKCDIVCSNCHRNRTYLRSHNSTEECLSYKEEAESSSLSGTIRVANLTEK